MSSVSSIMAGLFTVAVIFGPGLVLLILGIRGRLLLDDPHCATCRHDLKTFGERPVKCPECGADLARRGAVRFGSRQRRPVFILIGVVLMVLAPLVIGGTSLLIARQARAQAAAAQAAQAQLLAAAAAGWTGHTPSELIAALPNNWTDRRLHEELASRIRAGSLADQEIAALAEAVIAAMPSSMPVSTRQSIQSAGGEMIGQLVIHPSIESDRLKRLIMAWTGPAEMSLRARVAEGVKPAFTLNPRGMDSSGLTRGARLRALRIDGMTLARDPTKPAGDAGDLRRLPVLPPGTHTVEFELEWVAVAGPSLDTPSSPESVAPGRRERPRATAVTALREDSPIFERRDAIPDPPSAPIRRIAHGVEVVTRTVTVIPRGEPVVTPVVEPELRALVRGAFSVTEAGVRPRPDGSRKLRVQVGMKPLREVPLVVRARVTIGGQVFHSLVVIGTATENSSSRTGSLTIDVPVEDLDPGVTTIHVALEPALADENLAVDFDRAWGEEIDLGAVPVRRVDLESGASREPTETSS